MILGKINGKKGDDVDHDYFFNAVDKDLHPELFEKTITLFLNNRQAKELRDDLNEQIRENDEFCQKLKDENDPEQTETSDDYVVAFCIHTGSSGPTQRLSPEDIHALNAAKFDPHLTP